MPASIEVGIFSLGEFKNSNFQNFTSCLLGEKAI